MQERDLDMRIHGLVSKREKNKMNSSTKDEIKGLKGES
jgi:hypothetical protein